MNTGNHLLVYYIIDDSDLGSAGENPCCFSFKDAVNKLENKDANKVKSD